MRAKFGQEYGAKFIKRFGVIVVEEVREKVREEVRTIV